MTRNPAVGNTPLRLSVLSGVSALVESVPLKQVVNADAKMMAGKARFRMVLTMNNLVGDPAKTYLNIIGALIVELRRSAICVFEEGCTVAPSTRVRPQVSTCRQAPTGCGSRFCQWQEVLFNEPPTPQAREFINHFVSQADSWHVDCISAKAGEPPMMIRGRNEHHSAPTRLS